MCINQDQLKFGFGIKFSDLFCSDLLVNTGRFAKNKRVLRVMMNTMIDLPRLDSRRSSSNVE